MPAQRDKRIPDDAEAKALAERLRELKHQAGNPSYRVLGDLAHISHNALSQAVDGRYVGWARVEQYILALRAYQPGCVTDEDVHELRRLHRQARQAREQRRRDRAAQRQAARRAGTPAGTGAGHNGQLGPRGHRGPHGAGGIGGMVRGRIRLAGARLAGDRNPSDNGVGDNGVGGDRVGDRAGRDDRISDFSYGTGTRTGTGRELMAQADQIMATAAEEAAATRAPGQWHTTDCTPRRLHTATTPQQLADLLLMLVIRKRPELLTSRPSQHGQHDHSPGHPRAGSGGTGGSGDGRGVLVSAVAAGQLPTPDVLGQLVDVCGGTDGDRLAWTGAWQRVHTTAHDSTPGPGSAAGRDDAGDAGNGNAGDDPSSDRTFGVVCATRTRGKIAELLGRLGRITGVSGVARIARRRDISPAETPPG
jgi:hypothetical protein